MSYQSVVGKEVERAMGIMIAVYHLGLTANRPMSPTLWGLENRVIRQVFRTWSGAFRDGWRTLSRRDLMYPSPAPLHFHNHLTA